MADLFALPDGRQGFNTALGPELTHNLDESTAGDLEPPVLSFLNFNPVETGHGAAVTDPFWTGYKGLDLRRSPRFPPAGQDSGLKVPAGQATDLFPGIGDGQ
jgi:hypothetical protein